MQYRRTGNRSNYEQISFGRRDALACLVLAECVEGSGRFVDDIVNGIWCICEETFWGVPAHNGAARFPSPALPDVSEPIIDLFASETSSLLAITLYLLRTKLDTVSPIVCDRIRQEIGRRIIGPYLSRNDFWWMGLTPDGKPNTARSVNNWNPWCNSNVLISALLLSDDQARLAVLQKALLSLDQFINVYHPDGGCDEGTSYWGRAGGSLFDCLEFLYSATAGGINVYGEPLIANMGRYLYRMCIMDDWYVNFADGGARVGISEDLVYRYGRRIGDVSLMSLGALAHQKQIKDGASDYSGRLSSIYRRIEAILGYREISDYEAVSPYVKDTWLEGIQVMAARETEDSTAGFFLAAKGGHNNESHNHNDVGNFIVFCDGDPILIDIGVETYTQKTFSGQRYEIWTMQSGYHNLPAVAGVQQVPGESFHASSVEYKTDENRTCLSMDISKAYSRISGIKEWRRSFTLTRRSPDNPGAVIEIEDTFDLAKESEVVFSLMLPRGPMVSAPGKLLLTNGEKGLNILFDFNPELDAEIERIEINDGRLKPVWGSHVYRVLLRTTRAVSQGTYCLRVKRG